MKVIERYILGRGFLLFAGTLAATISVVWTIQVLHRVDLVTSSGQSAATFLRIATLILPSVVPEVLPFAVVIAVAQTFAAMNADSELVVVSAAGSSRWSTVKPMLILGMVASLTSFFFANVVDPYSKTSFRTLLANAKADLVSVVLQEGTFRKIEDGLFLQIAERLPDGQLGGIFVADSRTEGVDLVYYAKTGQVTDEDGRKILVMHDGVVHRKTVGNDISIIRFTSYSFDLTTLTTASPNVVMRPRDRSLAFLLDPDPNDPMYKEKPQAFWAELNSRLTEWTYPFVFALIGLAVAGDARSHREGRIHPVITAVAIALVARWLGYVATNETETSPDFAWMLYAVPLAFSLIASWFIYTNRTMELPLAWAEGAGNQVSRLLERLRLRSSSPAGTA